jgi:amino acid transporter
MVNAAKRRSLSFSTAAFAYAGVEVITASALEARWTRSRDGHRSQRKTEDPSTSNTVKLAATTFPIFIMIAYVLSGILISGNISQDDLRLQSSPSTRSYSIIMSTIVAIAIDCPDGSGIAWASAVNVIVIFTASTCAITSLYISSRSLFGILVRLGTNPREHWLIRFAASLGKTSKTRVPLRALGITLLLVYFILLFHARIYGECATHPEGLELQSVVRSQCECS